MSDGATPSIESLLEAAVGGEGPAEAVNAAALRLRCRLQPAGGAGAKLMPPTYSGLGGQPVYISEERRIDGEVHHCILLDGVASQANRLEDALAAAVDRGEVSLPNIEVDQAQFGLHSALEFSHRCFDAWVEDAELGGTRFGDTDQFTALATTTSRHDVTALMSRFPVGIVLGCWASRTKNPQGAARLARMLVSEIVAVDSVAGERPAGRLDRNHVSAAVHIYESGKRNERFTLDPDAAIEEKGKPRPFGRTGRPSEAGYGNVTPSLAEHGGITASHALQIAMLSLPAVRECSFPVEGDISQDRDVAARQVLVALAIVMLKLQVDAGYDLRSGCLLVPEEEPSLELVGRLGKPAAAWPLGDMNAEGLFESAVRRATDAGLPWQLEPLRLTASEQQLALLTASLEHQDEDGGGE